MFGFGRSATFLLLALLAEIASQNKAALSGISPSP